MSDPTGKAARQARSRAACIGCRQTKQRCDGPTRIPCRRCELYGIECEYGSSAGPVASKPAPAPAARPPPAAFAGLATVTADERLKEITDRLKSIEAQLAAVTLGSPGSSHLHRPSLHEHTSPSSASHSHTHEPSTPSASELDQGEPSAQAQSATPISTVTETLDLLDQMSSKIEHVSPVTAGANEKLSPGLGRSPNPIPKKKYGFSPRPDVLERGILTIQECEASLRIFDQKLSPWIGIDPSQGLDAMSLRAKSPILFHAILLSTAYYLTGTDRGSQVYYSLTALMNELISPALISPQARMLNSDLIRALSLVMLWKPVQHAMFAEMGIESEEQMERLAKLSPKSTALLSGILSRAAYAIHLPTISSTFAKAFEPGKIMDSQILADLRMHYWWCVIDTHRQLTVGILGEIDPREALKTTRLLAAVKASASDVRLAASVEIYAIVKDNFGLLDIRRNSTAGLRKFNRDLDEHAAYWTAELREASVAGDPLAYFPLTILSNFVRLIVNASVFTRWRHERKAALARGDTQRPQLSAADWDAIAHVVNSAEAILFSVSISARAKEGTTDGPLRTVDWPAYAKGQPRPPLEVDPGLCQMHITSFDTVCCITYVYTSVLLAKLANSGLITCELNLLYDQDAIDNEPRRLVNGAKLGALISLTASFMEASSPTSTHPSRTNARMLRMILAAGTMGQSVPVDPKQHLSDLESEIQRQLALNGMVGHGGVVPGTRKKHESAAACVNGAMLGEEEIADAVALQHLDLRSAQASSQPQPVAQGDAGEMLASVLAGLSPSYFGASEPSNVSTAPRELPATGFASGAAFDFEEAMQGVAVDWDTLEKSLHLQQELQPVVLPDLTGWESFWAQGNQPVA